VKHFLIGKIFNEIQAEIISDFCNLNSFAKVSLYMQLPVTGVHLLFFLLLKNMHCYILIIAKAGDSVFMELQPLIGLLLSSQMIHE
jgi:hypothetical protein